jgi:hypothetical protein
MQREVVILTDVSKQSIGPIIKGQGLTLKNWTDRLCRNVGKDCYRSLIINLEERGSHLLSVTLRVFLDIYGYQNFV